MRKPDWETYVFAGATGLGGGMVGLSLMARILDSQNMLAPYTQEWSINNHPLIPFFENNLWSIGLEVAGVGAAGWLLKEYMHLRSEGKAPKFRLRRRSGRKS